MRKQKTREQILNSAYISKTECHRLLGIGYKEASKIYDIAVRKDREEMCQRLIYENGEKARLTSVCWAAGVNLNTLKKQQEGN